jgi:SpoIID/LytB domain protein
LAYNEAGNYNAAINTLTKARNTLPSDKRCQVLINKLLAEHPRDEVKKAEQDLKRKERLNPPQVKNFPQSYKNYQSVPVRIGLVERARTFTLKTGAKYYLVGDDAEHTGAPGQLLFVKLEEDSINIYDKNNKLLISGSQSVTLHYSDNSATSMVFDIANGEGYFFASQSDRSYRGALEIMLRTDNSLTLVNILDMEEYLYSVVPSEIPASWPEEALKAQAVAARTYTLATMGTYASRGFDLYSSVVSHAYSGVAGENSRTTAAVNATLGQVLYRKDKKAKKNQLLIAYYSANNGGYTEQGDVIWNGLRGSEHLAVPDIKVDERKDYLPLYQLRYWTQQTPVTYSNWPKYNQNRAAYRSINFITADELKLRVANNGVNIGSVRSLVAINRGISGRAAVVEATGDAGISQIKGDKIRSRAGNLRSNLYTLDMKLNKQAEIEYFIYYTAGWGHGVGMDQTGAAGMADDGYDYKQILSHYYPNGKLANYNR